MTFASLGVMVLASCSGDGGGSSPSQAQGASSPASVPTSAAASLPAVDLIFTGDTALAAKGSAGRCVLGTGSDGTISFGFEATEADYPGLGDSFSLANLSGDYVDVKWLVDQGTAYGNTSTTSIVLSPDHHSVEIDGNLAPGHEHVKGTVSCP